MPTHYFFQRIVFLGSLFVFPFFVHASSLPNGTLIQKKGDSKVYVVADGTKRWVDTPDTIRVHGLHWGTFRIVDNDTFDAYSEGEKLTSKSSLLFSEERAGLPDLAPFAPTDLQYDHIDGRLVLRFSGNFWNKGNGKLELRSNSQRNISDGVEIETFQRIFSTSGSSRGKYVGQFVWHPPHHHYHFGDFADYIFRPAFSSQNEASVVTKKTTFCLRDSTPVDRTLKNAPTFRYFVDCSRYGQGVSVGWADVYLYSLPDQFIDVQDIAPGIYELLFVADPRGHFTELDVKNNIGSTFIEMNPSKKTLHVLASSSPFETKDNHFIDGLLLREEGTDSYFVTRGNKKRLLRSDEAIASYEYDKKNALTLPKSNIDSIPNDKLVRVRGTQKIYVVTQGGYRKPIHTLAEFFSYKTDFAEITPEEFITYREMPNVVDVVAENLRIPWDIVFLPDGDMLVTERPGTVRRIGKRTATIAIAGVHQVGEGGLMGMVLHPNFLANQLVYLYMTVNENGRQKNRIIRYRLTGDILEEEKLILDNIPASLFHDGGRMAFGPDGMLYVTTGDASTPELAQDLSSLAGKTLRLTPEGGIPKDNPFGTLVWSYGHRNSQGLAWDSEGRLWETEHGRSGALSGLDELNRVEKGKNYGWPIIQGDGVKSGMVAPIKHSGAQVTWAPAGLVYTKGKLYFVGLRGSALYEATLGSNGTIIDFKTYFQGEYGRLREVELGPDDYLYVTTSNTDGRGNVQTGDDKILRIRPELLTTLHD